MLALHAEDTVPAGLLMGVPRAGNRCAVVPRMHEDLQVFVKQFCNTPPRDTDSRSTAGVGWLRLSNSPAAVHTPAPPSRHSGEHQVTMRARSSRQAAARPVKKRRLEAAEARARRRRTTSDSQGALLLPYSQCCCVPGSPCDFSAHCDLCVASD